MVVPGRDGRHQQAVRQFAPRHPHHHHRAEIGKQHEREPSQERGVAFVAKEYLQHGAGRADDDHVEVLRPADQQVDRVRHGAKVRADIDRVGGEHERDDALQHPVRIVPADVAGDAVAGGPADARADFLDRHHQRIAEQHRPADGEAELRAGLRIGADPARVVVRCAGDEARAENLHTAAFGARRFLFRLLHRHPQRSPANRPGLKRSTFQLVPPLARTPVIPPPGTPGGNPNVVPK